MESEVLDSLEDLKYERELDEVKLNQLLGNWKEFSELVSWLCDELKCITKLDEAVTLVETEDDATNFQVELSSLLKELGCPYSLVMDGNLGSRFDTKEKRLISLNFLASELLSRRMLFVDKPRQLEIQLDESVEAKLLKEIVIALGLGKPPDNISMKGLLSKIQDRTTEIKTICQAGKVDNTPIFTGVLNEKQWIQLEDLNKQFSAEYQIRREMLLKRLDVTIQSFAWSDRLADKRESMTTIFRDLRKDLGIQPRIKLSDILAARTDLSYIEKTSSASVRRNTKSVVNSIVIGKVPDRGGRPSETKAPAPEMPSWQQRQPGSSGSVGWTPRGGRGGGESGRGGRGSRGGGRGNYSNENGGEQGSSRGGRDHNNQYRGGGRGGYDNDRGQGGHYGTNERWNHDGGRGGYQNRHGGGQDLDGNNERGDQQQYYRDRGGSTGNRSRVQGGWSNY